MSLTRSFPRNKLDEIIKVESRATGGSRANDKSQFHVLGTAESLPSGSLNTVPSFSGPMDPFIASLCAM